MFLTADEVALLVEVIVERGVGRGEFLQTHSLNRPRADLRGEQSPAPVHPKPHGLMADVHALLEAQVFDIPE